MTCELSTMNMRKAERLEESNVTFWHCSHSTRCSCMWSLPLSQVCVCVCDLWWSESLFVLSSVKASASRRARPYASHYTKVPSQSRRRRERDWQTLIKFLDSLKWFHQRQILFLQHVLVVGAGQLPSNTFRFAQGQTHCCCYVVVSSRRWLGSLP